MLFAQINCITFELNVSNTNYTYYFSVILVGCSNKINYRYIYGFMVGIAKSGGIEPLKPLYGRVARAYLIGQAAESFKAAIGDAHPTEICGTLDKAVAAALRDARRDSPASAVVLLSPACASFDQYPNFEVRGEAFVRAVAELPGVEMTVPGDSHAART